MRGSQRNASHYSWLAHICRYRGCPVDGSPCRSTGWDVLHPTSDRWPWKTTIRLVFSLRGSECGGIRSDRVLFLLFPIALYSHF